MEANEVKQLIADALKQQKEQTDADVSLLKEKVKAGNNFARQLKIKQETAKFPEPADKKAVEYLWDEKLDVDEISESYVSLFGDESAEDGFNFSIDDSNKAAVSDLLKRTVKYLNMRQRKAKRQIERYRVAVNSAGGWATEKKYRADAIFLDDETCLPYILQNIF